MSDFKIRDVIDHNISKKNKKVLTPEQGELLCFRKLPPREQRRFKEISSALQSKGEWELFCKALREVREHQNDNPLARAVKNLGSLSDSLQVRAGKMSPPVLDVLRREQAWREQNHPLGLGPLESCLHRALVSPFPREENAAALHVFTKVIETLSTAGFDLEKMPSLQEIYKYIHEADKESRTGLDSGYCSANVSEDLTEIIKTINANSLELSAQNEEIERLQRLPGRPQGLESCGQVREEIKSCLSTSDYDYLAYLESIYSCVPGFSQFVRDINRVLTGTSQEELTIAACHESLSYLFSDELQPFLQKKLQPIREKLEGSYQKFTQLRPDNSPCAVIQTIGAKEEVGLSSPTNEVVKTSKPDEEEGASVPTLGEQTVPSLRVQLGDLEVQQKFEAMSETIDNYEFTDKQDWSFFIEYAAKSINDHSAKAYPEALTFDLLSNVQNYIEKKFHKRFGIHSSLEGLGKGLRFYNDLSNALYKIHVYAYNYQINPDEREKYQILSKEEVIKAFQTVERLMKEPPPDPTPDNSLPALIESVLYQTFRGASPLFTKLHQGFVKLHQEYNNKSVVAQVKEIPDERFQIQEPIGKVIEVYGYITSALSAHYLKARQEILKVYARKEPKLGKFLNDLQKLIRYNEMGLQDRERYRDPAMIALHRAWWGYLSKHDKSIQQDLKFIENNLKDITDQLTERAGKVQQSEDKVKNFNTRFQRKKILAQLNGLLAQPRDPFAQYKDAFAQYQDTLAQYEKTFAQHQDLSRQLQKLTALNNLRQYIGQYIKQLRGSAYWLNLVGCTIEIGTNFGSSQGVTGEKPRWDSLPLLDKPIVISEPNTLAHAIKDIPSHWEDLQEFWRTTIKKAQIDDSDSYETHSKYLSTFQKKRLHGAYQQLYAYFFGKALQEGDTYSHLKILEDYLGDWGGRGKALAERWITYGRYGPQNDEERVKIYWATVDFTMIQLSRLEDDHDRQIIGDEKYQQLQGKIAGRLEQLKKIYDTLPESLKQPKAYTQEDLTKAVEEFSRKRSTERKILIKACEVAAQVDDQLHARLMEIHNQSCEHGGNPEMAVEALDKVMKYMLDPQNNYLMQSKEEFQDLLGCVNEYIYARISKKASKKEADFFDDAVWDELFCFEKAYDAARTFSKIERKLAPLSYALRLTYASANEIVDNYIITQWALYATYQLMKEPEINRLIKEEPDLQPVLALFEEIEEKRKEAGL